NGTNLYESNLLVGVNDSYSNGFTTIAVYTSFPAGTRLQELTGNAADAIVDPTNQIDEVIVTQPFDAAHPAVSQSQSWVTLKVPLNKNVNGVSHHRGYVLYGPAVPTGTFGVTQVGGGSFTGVIPADVANVPSYRRRLTSVPVVDSAQFEIRLTT